MSTETTVRQLSEMLQAMPQDAKVEFRLPPGRRYNGGDGFDPKFVEYEEFASEPGVLVVTQARPKKSTSRRPIRVELSKERLLEVLGEDGKPMLRVYQGYGKEVYIDMCSNDLTYYHDEGARKRIEIHMIAKGMMKGEKQP